MSARSIPDKSHRGDCEGVGTEIHEGDRRLGAREATRVEQQAVGDPDEPDARARLRETGERGRCE
jgi:hypothetical protein